MIGHAGELTSRGARLGSEDSISNFPPIGEPYAHVRGYIFLSEVSIGTIQRFFFGATLQTGQTNKGSSTAVDALKTKDTEAQGVESAAVE
jgi:hypothetical protein